MFRFIIYSFIIIFNSLVCNDLYAQIFINEVMPNNESCISDYDGENNTETIKFVIKNNISK